MNSKYKGTGAYMNTVTYDRTRVEAETDNIYEAINIIAKRADQINVDLKEELQEKLQDFTTPGNGVVEEIFENREQIAISKLYERLPKAHAIAIKEWLDKNLYYQY